MSVCVFKIVNLKYIQYKWNWGHSNVQFSCCILLNVVEHVEYTKGWKRNEYKQQSKLEVISFLEFPPPLPIACCFEIYKSIKMEIKQNAAFRRREEAWNSG